MKNTIIIICAMNHGEAERILKLAEQVLRANWVNVYGLRRRDSGYRTILTDGFGNPYGEERKLRVFGISIEVPDGMDRQVAMSAISWGAMRVNCYAEYYFA